MDILPVALAGIGGAALLAAGVARAVMAARKPKTVLNAQAGQSDGEERSSPHISPAETESQPNSLESDGIEWQDSEDVYAPAPVVAAQFVTTLGLARVPAMLPQQAYIFVNRSALEKIQAHLRGNVEVEQGGLILGQAFLDSALGTYLLIIHDALPAPDGIETPTFFGYTTASWRALAPQIQQMAADWTLIGSYHSHPNMGVFLSQTDLDTQEDIFCADWQIALVIDPVKDEIGFFVGKDGEKCDNWYYLDGETQQIQGRIQG